MEMIVLAIAPTSVDFQGRRLQNPPTHGRTLLRLILQISLGTLTSQRGEASLWKGSAKLDELLPSKYHAKPLTLHPKQHPIWFQVVPAGQAWQTSDILVIRLIQANFLHFPPSPLYRFSVLAFHGFSFGDWQCDCCQHRV